MTLGNLFLGLAIGLPMMIAVGPISVLLLDQGLERGMRIAAPAALGVAAADFTLSIVASLAGTTIASALGPFTSLLTVAAVLVLVALAISLGRAALAELRAARPSVALAPASRALAFAGVDHLGGDESLPTMAATDVDTDQVAAGGAAFSRLTGGRLAAAFYGFTLVNPLTLVLFASVVVAGGAGVGSAGWALGMSLASLVAHGGFVVAGGLLRSRLSPVASGRLRLGAAVFMAGLAVHFAAGI